MCNISVFLMNMIIILFQLYILNNNINIFSKTINVEKFSSPRVFIFLLLYYNTLTLMFFHILHSLRFKICTECVNNLNLVYINKINIRHLRTYRIMCNELLHTYITISESREFCFRI